MTKVCPVTEKTEQIISAWAFAHNIDGAARNDLFARLRAARIPDPEAAKLREALQATVACLEGCPDPEHVAYALDKALAALNPSPALVGDEDAAR